MLGDSLLIVCDRKKTVYEDDNFLIIERCNRGYEPWYTLHIKRRLLGFEWWSGMKHWGDREPLIEYVKRWNKWV